MERTEKLFQENIGLVRFVLRRQFPSLSNDEDLFQEGCIGLWKACLSYDADRGFKCSTYAVPCIRNAILMELRRRRRIPVSVSLDAPLGNDDDALCIGDVLEDPQASDFTDSIFADDITRRLSDRDRRIVDMMHAGMTQQEAGAVLGLSQVQISRRLGKIKVLYQRTAGGGKKRKETAVCKTR